MTVSISGTNGVTFPDSSLQTAAASPYVLKNRIINGDMRIDQRNAGASVTIPAALTYTLDRWQAQSEQASKYSVEQTITGVAAPTGFTDYLGATSLSAYSVLTDDRFVIRQIIEGFNVGDLGFGTANAKTVTISFWVRSSLTGSFGGYIGNSALDRAYPFSYTISAANTWEQKSVTIAGDTSGTWLTNNGVGLRLGFSLGVGATYTGTGGAWASSQILAPTGSTSVVGTSGATWYITGVQLEVGTTATPFERRLYNQELANCQRYYYRISPSAAAQLYGSGFASTTTVFRNIIQYPVTLRDTPTALEQSGTASDYSVLISGNVLACSAVPALSQLGPVTSGINLFVASGLTSGHGGGGRAVNTNAFLAWSAEL
jgi:hypothetical protein